MGNEVKKAAESETFESTLEAMEGAMLQCPQADCPVIHRFGPGIYIRELHMSAGTLAIGHYQKTEHMNVFLKGRVTMLKENGVRHTLTAPMIFTAPPGRKIGYVHEDVVWLNIYATEETDVETLEKTYFDKSPTWLEHQEQVKKAIYLKAVNDYNELLMETGYSEDTVRRQAENTEDQISMPHGDYKFMVGLSSIEGMGLIATANIEAGEIIGPARIAGKRTPIGRYANHSPFPNAKMIKQNEDIYLMATHKIEGCKGGQPGQEITTNYRDNLKLIGAIKCQALQPQ